MKKPALSPISGANGVLKGHPRHLHRLRRAIAERFRDVSLTPREEVIILLLLQGYANKEIAQSCSISVQTVKDHLKHVYRKAGGHQRTALIAQLWGMTQF